MAILRHFYPIFRRNSTFLAFIVAGGLVFEQVFNRSTRYYFYEVLNKGVRVVLLFCHMSVEAT